MATTNLTLSAADGWTLVVPSAATWALVSSLDPDTNVEFATSVADGTLPTVLGHTLKREQQQVSRAHFVEGPIFAKVPAAERYGSASVILVVDHNG
jgi:hypothetical protein